MRRWILALALTGCVPAAVTHETVRDERVVALEAVRTLRHLDASVAQVSTQAVAALDRLGYNVDFAGWALVAFLAVLGLAAVSAVANHVLRGKP